MAVPAELCRLTGRRQQREAAQPAVAGERAMFGSAPVDAAGRRRPLPSFLPGLLLPHTPYYHLLELDLQNHHLNLS